jgi:hypothetical protein
MPRKPKIAPTESVSDLPPRRAKPLRLKVVSKDYRTDILDAETGESLGLKVMALKFEHGSDEDFPRLTFTVIDFEIDADVRVVCEEDHEIAVRFLRRIGINETETVFRKTH